MKLYDVPRNTLVRILDEELVLPPESSCNPIKEVKFLHIDGMYSLCVDEHGDTVHLAAWTEVEIIEPLL